MAPTATPSAATVPTSIFLAGAGGLAAPTWAVAVALVAMNEWASASPAAARLATCSSSRRTNRLYGDQNACRMLIGFSMIFVIVASQSCPRRS